MEKESVMKNSGKKEKLRKKRFWIGFLGVFPFGILFIIGCLSIKDSIIFLFRFHNYSAKTMMLYAVESGAIGRAGAHSVYGIGVFNGVEERIFLGVLSENNVKNIINKIGREDSVQLNVMVSEYGDIVYMKENASFKLKTTHIFNISTKLLLLCFPSILCFIVYYAYTLKIKKCTL